MKNKLFKILLLIVFNFGYLNIAYSNDDFNFKITEIEILENGNLILGSKGGKAVSENGSEIIGENFNYNKITNILKISNNVKFIDKKNGVVIYSDKVTYLKNEEKILQKEIQKQ